MYTPRKIHSGFIGLILIAVAFILFFFSVRPLQKHIEELKAEVMMQRQFLQDLEKEASQPISEVAIQNLTVAIPESLEQDTVVAMLGKLAKENDVTLSSLTFALRENPSDIKRMTISLAISGGSSNVQRFVKSLELQSRKILVRDLNLQFAENVAGIELVHLTLSAEAYFQ